MEKKEKDYGLGWFYFYIKWRFPISFVLGTFAIIREIIQLGVDRNLLSYPLFTLAVLADILVEVFAVIVYLHMRKLKPSGYILNKWQLTIECLTFALVSAMNSTNTKMTTAFILSFLTDMLVWGIPNYVYFKHRRFLFDGLSTLNDLGNSTAVERKREILFCDNCGFVGLGPIQSETRQCPKCSIPLTNTHVSRGTWTDLPEQGKSFYFERWKQSKTETAKTGKQEEKSYDMFSKNTPVAQFCRNCGTKLSPDIVFCPNCGTKVIQYSKLEKVPEKFGDALTKESNPIIHNFTKPAAEDFRKELPARLRRAFMLAEDGEWEKADEYFERVLDEDPENAYAYLGKVLCENRIHNITDLNSVQGIAQNKSILRAQQYADDKLKSVIQAIVE